MNSQNVRANFRQPVVTKLAQRAAYRCSFPGCEQTTVGPGLAEGQSVITGVASHIYSAAEGGPRGTGGLSDEERRSIENGLWLCANHAATIDKNNGLEYPASLLLTYKRLHEAKIVQERDGLKLGLAWIHSLRIERGPVFRMPIELRFGQITVLTGGNGSGKTAICDLLEAVSDPSIACEWSRRSTQPSLTYELTYLNPATKQIRVQASKGDQVAYFADGDSVPLPPDPIKFIRLKDVRATWRGGTDLSFLSEAFRLHPALVRNMLPLVSGQKAGTVTRLEVLPNEDGEVLVSTEVDGTIPGLSLQQLSNSERCRVLMELAVALARQAAKQGPTVLLLDWAAKSLDSAWVRKMISFLSDDDNRFQTVIELVDAPDDIRSFATVVRLVGKQEDVYLAPECGASLGVES